MSPLRIAYPTATKYRAKLLQPDGYESHRILNLGYKSTQLFKDLQNSL
jgi:hypothetical protein